MRLSIVIAIAVVFLTTAIAPATAAETEPAGGGYAVGFSIADIPYTDKGKPETLTVAIWYPTSDIPGNYVYSGPVKGNVAFTGKPLVIKGKSPLLVFSHGYGGSGLQPLFLAERLARRGWVVLCPDHNDNESAVRIREDRKKRFNRIDMFLTAKKMVAKTPQDREIFTYRTTELASALDWVLQSENYGTLIDTDKIAVGGHSLGAFTALTLCGTIKDREDKRIKALLLFSSGAAGYLFTEQEIAAVKIPSIYFIGEKEEEEKRGETTMLQLAHKIEENLPAPKYFYEIKGATHFSFMNGFPKTDAAKKFSGTPELFDAISRYSIAFLEKHAAGNASAGAILEQSDPLVTKK